MGFEEREESLFLGSQRVEAFVRVDAEGVIAKAYEVVGDLLVVEAVDEIEPEGGGVVAVEEEMAGLELVHGLSPFLEALVWDEVGVIAQCAGELVLEADKLVLGVLVEGAPDVLEELDVLVEGEDMMGGVGGVNFDILHIPGGVEFV